MAVPEELKPLWQRVDDQRAEIKDLQVKQGVHEHVLTDHSQRFDRMMEANSAQHSSLSTKVDNLSLSVSDSLKSIERMEGRDEERKEQQADKWKLLSLVLGLITVAIMWTQFVTP